MNKIKNKKGAVKNPTDFFGTIFTSKKGAVSSQVPSVSFLPKGKKGVEMTLNTIVILIILVIVLVIMIFFFTKYYSENSNGINNISDTAINMSKNYK